MSYYFLLITLLLSGCKSENKIKLDKNYANIHQEALDFVASKNMNTDVYYLLDFSIHSGKNRFFVYNFKTKKIIDSAVVTHGSCDVFSENASKYDKAIFSNRENSHCSSKGKYKIGARDKSSWGIGVKYWLHGLESSNNNAAKRVVVFHSWSAVSDEEIYPNHSPLSWGCPAVSDAFMTKIDKELKTIQKPVLMWIIE
uniref:murein L,D-transpeptidase catalytic domain-containing protein n=1 Tax=Flavobacterium sp. TaxID=239 RepID=UPI004049D062